MDLLAQLPLTTPASAVLFLDFDGVLQTPALDGWLEMELCHELIALLNRCPALSVVVTSTHREGRSLEDVKLLLPAEIACRLVGLTPIRADGRAAGGRQREIEDWLMANPAVTRWVSVDDERHLFQESCRWAVFTHPWVGWQESTTDAVCAVLTAGGKPQPTMTGTCSTPNSASASHRCLPSMKNSSSAGPLSTGRAGKSCLDPLATSRSHSFRYPTRPLSGKSGAVARAKLTRWAVFIRKIFTGFRTNP